MTDRRPGRHVAPPLPLPPYVNPDPDYFARLDELDARLVTL